MVSYRFISEGRYERATAAVPTSTTDYPKIRSTADFARLVGLSRSTVSRVLNGQPGLRKSTITRVNAAIEETGFTPNAHALHLRGKKPAMIGVCMENLLTPTAVAKVASLQKYLRDHGYDTLIEVVEPNASRAIVRHLCSLRVGAVVFIGHFITTELRLRIGELRRFGVPHLVVDNPGIEEADTVSLDRVRALDEVTTHLLNLGHRRFGLLGISGIFQSIIDRLSGIRSGLARKGLDPARCTLSLDPPQAWAHGADHFEYGCMLARGFLGRRDMPTAFIAVNDDIAIGALIEFQSHGLRVPEDLSIVGFNNLPVCMMTRPCLTTVDQQIESCMQQAGAFVLRRVGSSAKRNQTLRLVKPLLVVRQSTGKVRSA